MTSAKEQQSYVSSHSSVASRQLPYLRGAADSDSTTSDDAIDMIFDILQLSRDLRKHAIIEDKILGPYVKQLEKTTKL